MERSREARTATMAAADRVSRRRQRSTSSRDSPEEGRQIELQETGRFRDRAAKRGQNREFSNRKKRKRVDRFANGSNRDGEDSTEESVGDEEYVAENGGVSTTLQNTTPFSSHNLRKSARFVKKACKGGDEMIGVTVPRKARSASAKKSHENWVSGYVGGSGGEEQNLRQLSYSPSSSNVSVRKKMKPNGPKTRATKASKLSSSIQDDIEIEVAEVLYGLMKQSQSSKVLETTESSSQNDGPEFDPLIVLKRKKVEAKNISTANQTQNSSISPSKMEFSSAELEKIPELTAQKCEASMGTQQEDLKPVIKDSGTGDEVFISEKPVSLKEELASCAKLDVDIQDSTTITAISNVSEVENQKEDQFKIDLMALPSMVSPPKRDCLVDLKMKTSVKDERIAAKEAGVEEHEKKMESIGETSKLQKLDSDKLGQDGEIDSDSKPQHKGAIIPKEEKIAQSSALRLPFAVAGWPGSLTPLGYVPPFQTAASMDGNTGSSMADRPKRCATHQYIAHNIYLHQQFTKMNQFWPAGSASAAVYGAKPCNLNLMPATNQLYGKFPSLNLKSTEDKGPAVANCPDRNGKVQSSKASKGPAAATFPGRKGKDQSSKASELMDTAKRKYLVFQQVPQPVPPGSLMHGPAFVVPLSQHPSTPKSATLADNQSLSSKSVAGASSSVLPPVDTAVSFNYQNLAANEAPYLAILQNNGYPFPISTVGPTPAIRGTPDQAMPFFNGYFYPSQMFQASQLQQQQPQSQPLVQPAHQNTSTSSGTSSSQKRPETQQPRVLQVSGTNFLTSTSMQLQQSQQQRVPESLQYCKRETEMGGKNTQSVADTRTSHSQNGVNGQKVQLNFASTPSATLGGAGDSGNHGEKQPRNSKGGVDLIPPQVFSMSFASLNGNNTASSLNFSTMAQNTAIFQDLPDLARQVYQFAPAAQVAEQKNNQISEGKTGGNSANLEDGRKTISGKMPTSIGQTIVFDNSARSLSFMSSPVMGNSSSSSISPTFNVTTSQQQQLLQLQKQHILQQQATGAARSKASTTDSQPSTFIATKICNSTPVLSKIPIQINGFVQSPQWSNSTRTPAQHQGRAPKGQIQISFGESHKSALAARGQQMPTNNQSPSPIVAGSPSNDGSMRTNCKGNKAGSSTCTLQSQQNENSAGTGQKSSPVCGRNVPSVLSTYPSHLSELKY